MPVTRSSKNESEETTVQGSDGLDQGLAVRAGGGVLPK